MCEKCKNAGGEKYYVLSHENTSDDELLLCDEEGKLSIFECGWNNDECVDVNDKLANKNDKFYCDFGDKDYCNLSESDSGVCRKCGDPSSYSPFQKCMCGLYESNDDLSCSPKTYNCVNRKIFEFKQ